MVKMSREQADSSRSRSKALKMLSKHPMVKPFLTGRYRNVLFETDIVNRRKREGPRQTVVGLYNYEIDKSVIALLDLKGEKVIDAKEAPVHFQLHSEEEIEAENLVSKDKRVKTFLKGRKMDPLTRLYFPPTADKHTPPHRYAIVFLRPTNSERRYAVVDLTTQSLVDVFGLNYRFTEKSELKRTTQ